MKKNRNTYKFFIVALLISIFIHIFEEPEAKPQMALRITQSSDCQPTQTDSLNPDIPHQIIK